MCIGLFASKNGTIHISKIIGRQPLLVKIKVLLLLSVEVNSALRYGVLATSCTNSTLLVIYL